MFSDFTGSYVIPLNFFGVAVAAVALEMLPTASPAPATVLSAFRRVNFSDIASDFYSLLFKYFSILVELYIYSFFTICYDLYAKIHIGGFNNSK
jgi:hypothetical protein